MEPKKSPNADHSWILFLLQEHGSFRIGSRFWTSDASRAPSLFLGGTKTPFLTICGAGRMLRRLSSEGKPVKCDNGRQKRRGNSRKPSQISTDWHQKHVQLENSDCFDHRKARTRSKTWNCGEIWTWSSDHSYRTAHPIIRAQNREIVWLKSLEKSCEKSRNFFVFHWKMLKIFACGALFPTIRLT